VSLLLVEAKVSQPVELILVWVEARFGVHAVVELPSVERSRSGDEGSCLPVPKAAEPRNTGPRNALPPSTVSIRQSTSGRQNLTCFLCTEL
jgi:hypothetical protein